MKIYFDWINWLVINWFRKKEDVEKTLLFLEQNTWLLWNTWCKPTEISSSLREELSDWWYLYLFDKITYWNWNTDSTLPFMLKRTFTVMNFSDYISI